MKEISPSEIKTGRKYFINGEEIYANEIGSNYILGVVDHSNTFFNLNNIRNRYFEKEIELKFGR